MNAAIEDGLTCATELPYFEGDFWPNVLEESIKELDQEEEERLKAAEKAAAAQSATEEVNASFKKVDFLHFVHPTFFSMLHLNFLYGKTTCL